MGPGFQGGELGSGVIIDKAKGYVVTNFHVVKDAVRIMVRWDRVTTSRHGWSPPIPRVTLPCFRLAQR